MTTNEQQGMDQLRNQEAVQDVSSMIAVMQFGSQHTLEIVDAIRSQGIDATVVPYYTPAEDLAGYGGIVLSGGDASVYDESSPRPDPHLFDLELPILGICYGAQLLAHAGEGSVEPGHGSEFGQHKIHRQDKKSPVVFTTQEQEQSVWMNHGDRITAVPDGYVVDAISAGGMIAAFRSKDNQRIGLQFHPEVLGEGRTENGSDMWARFLFDVAKIEPTFEAEDLDGRIATLTTKIGSRSVLAFLSGGVDSNVTAALLARAVPPEQVTAVHVDHGFMRQNESAEVLAALGDVGIHVRVHDAAEFFLNATTTIDNVETVPLREATDPEEKRMIIGDSFIRFQDKVAKELDLPEDYFLAQGTIRPDLIESGSHGTVTIKSHHNDSPLAREKRNKDEVIEPLADLYKPGVRALGRLLGLPDSLVDRQPFPGPGLGIRILCARGDEVTDEFLLELMNTEHLLKDLATEDVGITMIPVRSVGQRGESRSYGQTVVLSGKRDWAELRRLAQVIPERVGEVTRVAYAFGDKIEDPVSTLITPTQLGQETAAQLQHADAIVRAELTAAGLDKRLQQVPVILVHTGIDQAGTRSIVIRPFLTTNFMTGEPALPGSDDLPEEVLLNIVDRVITEVPGVSRRVLYDLTGKPPGTTEWE